LRVVFLGTAGAGGFPGRAQNCLLVEASWGRVLLDAGPGCGARLVEQGYSVCDLDVVYVSHLHLDHWSGLFDLAVQAISHGCGFPPVLAAGGVAADARERIRSLLPRTVNVEVRMLEETLYNGKLTPVESSHTIPCYGVIVADGGLRLYYSADTRPTARARDAVASSDLAALEATFPPGREREAHGSGHMTVSDAAGIAPENWEGTLALIHLSTESMKSLKHYRLPRKLIVPGDHTEVRI